MNVLAVVCGVLFVVVVALSTALVIALKRRTVQPAGQPTADEANISNVFERQKKEVRDSAPSGANVRRLSDAELESAINRRGPK